MVEDSLLTLAVKNTDNTKIKSIKDSSTISSLILDDNDILIGIIYKNGNTIFINGNKQVGDYTDDITPTKKDLHLKSDTIKLGDMTWIKYEPRGDVQPLKLYSTDKPKLYNVDKKDLYPLNPHFNSMIFVFTIITVYIFIIRSYNLLFKP